MPIVPFIPVLEHMFRIGVLLETDLIPEAVLRNSPAPTTTWPWVYHQVLRVVISCPVFCVDRRNLFHRKAPHERVMGPDTAACIGGAVEGDFREWMRFLLERDFMVGAIIKIPPVPEDQDYLVCHRVSAQEYPRDTFVAARHVLLQETDIAYAKQNEALRRAVRLLGCEV